MATINLPNIFGPINNPIQDFINNFTAQWGIYNAAGQSISGFGLSLIGATQSTYSFNFRRQTRVSDFPVQSGGFASYNKVLLPANPIVTLALTGNESDRTQFLNSIEAATQSTELFSVVTPEVQYINYTLEEYNYSRTAQQGTTLLLVEISLKEIRQVSLQTSTVQTENQNSSITNSNDPTASPSASSGQVQSESLNMTTQNTVNSQLGVNS
jgi:hypothetical protein